MSDPKNDNDPLNIGNDEPIGEFDQTNDHAPGLEGDDQGAETADDGNENLFTGLVEQTGGERTATQAGFDQDATTGNADDATESGYSEEGRP